MSDGRRASVSITFGFETPSEGSYPPRGIYHRLFRTNVQSHTEAEFDEVIDDFGAGLGIFTAEGCDVVLIGGITLGTQRRYAAEQQLVAELSRHVGLPVSTAMSATVQAMKHSNIRSTVIATAYKKVSTKRKKSLRRRRTRGTGDQGLRGLQTRGSGQASKLCIR